MGQVIHSNGSMTKYGTCGEQGRRNGNLARTRAEGNVVIRHHCVMPHLLVIVAYFGKLRLRAYSFCALYTFVPQHYVNFCSRSSEADSTNNSEDLS